MIFLHFNSMLLCLHSFFFFPSKLSRPLFLNLECLETYVYSCYQYADQSDTLKACVGLNGMKLGGQVITAVQAVPNAMTLVVPDHPNSYTEVFLFEYLHHALHGDVN